MSVIRRLLRTAFGPAIGWTAVWTLVGLVGDLAGGFSASVGYFPVFTLFAAAAGSTVSILFSVFVHHLWWHNQTLGEVPVTRVALAGAVTGISAPLLYTWYSTRSGSAMSSDFWTALVLTAGLGIGTALLLRWIDRVPKLLPH